MRITGGTLKGRIVKCPNGIIRPAMDRMRESLFAVLGDISGKSWLDLFSGSGTVAIEAASRGAGKIDLCEKDKIKIGVLLDNVKITEQELAIKIRCHFMPVEYFVKRCKEQFDFIFIDPPFPYKFREQLVESIAARGILQQNGTVLLHRPSEHKMPEHISNFILSEQHIYGRSVVDFYKQED